MNLTQVAPECPGSDRPIRAACERRVSVARPDRSTPSYSSYMIRSGRASLVVLSSDTEPATVSEILTIAPTEVARKGAARPSGRVRERHKWSLDVGTLANTEDDQTGSGALRELLIRASGAVGRVQDLPDDCDIHLWWSAGSDSSQGGFVLPVELVNQISALGVDVYVTVYLDEVQDACGLWHRGRSQDDPRSMSASTSTTSAGLPGGALRWCRVLDDGPQ